MVFGRVFKANMCLVYVDDFSCFKISTLVNCVLQTPEEDYAYLDLRQENEELLRRMAEVQQQMWTLEEKVVIQLTLAS